MASHAPLQTLELPRKLRELYDFLDGKGDVAILEIYSSLFTPVDTPLREAQMHLGPYITRLNRRLRNHRKAVRPGRMKGTYVLTLL